MKKGISKWFIMLVVIIMSVPQIFALSQIRVRVNGTQVYFPDGQPYIDENSRVLVPVRFVSEQLGATVKWDKTAKRVTIVDGDNQAILTINSKKIKVNGETKQLDTAAVLKNTRTYVPLRFVSEALGATVRWDSKVRIVYIDNGKAPLPEVKVMEAGPFTIPITADSVVGESEGSWGVRTENLVNLIHNDEEQKMFGTVLTIIVEPEMTVSYEKQCAQAKQILLQNFSPELVDKVINYVKTKTARRVHIQEKEYYEGNYKILVADNGEGANMVISIK